MQREENEMLRFLSAFVLVFCLSGCLSTKEPTIEPTKPWEGRYESLEKAAKALDSAAITENDRQVWVLQPTTLSRLLRNVEK